MVQKDNKQQGISMNMVHFRTHVLAVLYVLGAGIKFQCAHALALWRPVTRCMSGSVGTRLKCGLRTG